MMRKVSIGAAAAFLPSAAFVGIGPPRPWEARSS